MTKNTNIALFTIPVGLILSGCQPTTIHITQGAAAIAGSTSVADAGGRSTRGISQSSVRSEVSPEPEGRLFESVKRTPIAPVSQRKPEKREVYEEKTSTVVESFVVPASDQEFGR
jgi:hypothetical protein